MSKAISNLLFFLLLCFFAAAQQKTVVREYNKVFTTYPFSDPDPVPRVGRIYPYFRFDGYTDNPVQKEWKVVELENEYLKLMILPQIGGKIWAAIEKSTGKSFVYYNHVVKFRDVAMRGPWTSGGIEANYGIVGHTPNCATPVDYTVLQKKDGSVSCVIGVLDLLTRTNWRLDINLQPGKAYFTTASFWYNNTPLEQPYYTWMNAGIKAKGNLEFIYPGTRYLGHSGEYADWPVNKQNGKNISFYENNDFGTYKSYHVFGKYTDFFGGYWHDEDFGMGRYGAYDEKPGKKVWIWGLSQQGMIWEKLLSDTSGQYVEVQSGRLFNQAAEQSSFSPFKNIGFAPHATDVWTESWFPVLGTKGFVAANNYGALNVKKERGWLRIYFSPLQTLQDSLHITIGGRPVYAKAVNLKPLQLFADSVQVANDTGALVANLGSGKLIYEAAPEANVLQRPVQHPEDFKWNSAYGLYLQGKESMRMRNYVAAAEKLQASLQQEPYFVPALADYAMLLYHNRQYTAALEATRKALSIDTYDGAANYYYGLINRALGNMADAKDGFSIAALGVPFRSAAYTELAQTFLQENDFEKAALYARKSIDANRFAVAAYEVLAIVHRLQQNNGAAQSILDTLLSFDPLNHFARFEKYGLQKNAAGQQEALALIRNELPHETFLELAIRYYHLGRKAEAQQVLALSPQNAEVLYWQTFLAGRPLAVQQLKPDGVFPFRQETAAVLEQLIPQNNHWLLKYHLALIEWHYNNVARAKALFAQCGAPPYAPFYAARAELYRADSSENVVADLQKAAQLDRGQWRYGQSLVQHYLGEGNSGAALPVAAAYYKRFPQNYQLGLLYAKALMQQKEYGKAGTLLQQLRVLPNEGATAGRQLYREAHLMLALDAFRKKDYKAALNQIAAARQWPEHLGVGKPYDQDIDQRLEDWMAYEIYLLMGAEKEAQQMLSRVLQFRPVNESGTPYGSVNDLITAWALKESGQAAQASKLLQDWLQKNPENGLARWAMNMYNGTPRSHPAPDGSDERYRLLSQWIAR